MYIQLIPLIPISLFTVLGWRKANHYLLGFFAIILVALWFSFGTTVIYEYHFPFDFINKEAMIYLTIALFFMLLPLLAIKEKRILQIKHPNKGKLNYLIWFLIILTVPATLYFLPSLRNIFASDISTTRITNFLYNDYNHSIFHKLLTIISSLYFIELGVLIYCYFFQKTRFWVILLMFFGSLSFPLSILSVLGRGGIIIWLSAFILFSAFLFPFGSQKIKKQFIKFAIVIFIFFILIFCIITFNRFGEDSQDTIYTYIGGGPRNFSISYQLSDDISRRNGKGLFYLPVRFGELLMGKTKDKFYDQNIFLYNNDLIIDFAGFDAGGGQFTTFCGTILYEFNRTTSMVLIIAIGLLSWFFFRQKDTSISIGKLFGYIFYGSIIMTFPIGYVYIGLLGNIIILSLIVMAVFLKHNSKNSSLPS